MATVKITQTDEGVIVERVGNDNENVNENENESEEGASE